MQKITPEVLAQKDSDFAISLYNFMRTTEPYSTIFQPEIFGHITKVENYRKTIRKLVMCACNDDRFEHSDFRVRWMRLVIQCICDMAEMKSEKNNEK